MGKVLWSIFGVIVLVFVFYLGINRIAFRQGIENKIDAFDAQIIRQKGIFRYDSLTGLPAPVQRYFRFALPDGTPYIYATQFTQQGRFRLKEDSSLAEDEGWKALDAREYFSADPPAFFWTAGIHLAPLVSLKGWDRNLKGEGQRYWRLLSAIPIVNAGGPQIDQASLLRFLSEAVWIPTALLPGEYLEWAAIDPVSARATIHDHGSRVSAVFYFAADGRITHLVTHDKARRISGRQFTGDQWTGRFYDYRAINGIKIPTRSEAIWNLPRGDFSYSQLRISGVKFNGPFD